MTQNPTENDRRNSTNREYILDYRAFENRKQFSDYLEALRGKILPAKLAYCGHCAYTHDKLARSQEYGLFDIELKLIEDEFPSTILPKLDKNGLNVFDVGPGNGLKAAKVLMILHQELPIFKYVALDYSAELLKIAKRNISSKFPSLDMVTYQIDVEVVNFREIVVQIQTETGHSNLLLFLGSTLSNPMDRLGTLRNIRESMGLQDYLLLGAELYKPASINKMLNHYRNETFYQAILSFLTFAGLKRDDGLLEVSFNNVTKNVEVYFEFTSNICIHTSVSEKIRFKKGDRLLIFISHKFTEPELMETFFTLGLHVSKVVFNRCRDYALALVSMD